MIHAESQTSPSRMVRDHPKLFVHNEVIWSGLIALGMALLSNPMRPFQLNFQTSVLLLTVICLPILSGTVFRTEIRFPWPAVAWFGWTGIGVLWSTRSGETFRATLVLVAIAILGLLIGQAITVEALMRGLVAGACLIAGLSLAVSVIDPVHGFAHSQGRIIGINGYIGNYAMTSYTLLATLPAVLAYRFRGRLRATKKALTLAFVGGATAISGTTAAVIVMAITIAAYVAAMLATESHHILWRRIGKSLLIVCGGIGATTLVLFLSGFRPQGGLLSFSGRAALWHWALDAWLREPLRGFGFGTVWKHRWHAAPDNNVLRDIWKQSGVRYSHGHSAVLDLLVEIGIVGALAAVGLLVWLTVRSWRLLKFSPEVAVWQLLMVLVIAVEGYGEPTFTIPVYLFLLFLACGVSLIRPDSWADGGLHAET